MSNLTGNARKDLMNYLHKEFKNLFHGILCVVGGIVGMYVSFWILENIIDGYSGRINLFVFILPVIMGGLILAGVILILSFPFGMVKKSKHAKLLETEEGEKILTDFSSATCCYFEDEIRVGRLYLYKKENDFYPLYKIELFKLVKKEKKICLIYKIKNERELNLTTFDQDSWQKNKNDVVDFFEKIKIEHPEINIEIF